MHAASQLPGRGPTDVNDAPQHPHVCQKSYYDDMFRFRTQMGQVRPNQTRPGWRPNHTGLKGIPL